MNNPNKDLGRLTDPMMAHQCHMRKLSDSLRCNVRDIMKLYRQWQTSSHIVKTKKLYLDAEGEILRAYLKDMRNLYKQSHMDYLAMRRAYNHQRNSETLGIDKCTTRLEQGVQHD